MEELPIAELVTSCERRLLMYDAGKCLFNPNGVCGKSRDSPVIETTEAGVTLSSVDPPIPPRVAVNRGRPFRERGSQCAGTHSRGRGVPDFQDGRCCQSCVLPSVKIPVAVNCRVVPSAMDGWPDSL